MIARYSLRSQLPDRILQALETEQISLENESTAVRNHFVLLDNFSALNAAAESARRRGFVAELAEDISDQPIEAGCARLVERLEALRHQHPARTVCLISGGEFSCPVRGDGLGGRNSETALRLGCSANLNLAKLDHFVALCAGTDGLDGNSPAAGAIVDNTTIERARAIGLDPENFLDRSDAYSFFVALGDVIVTGPTGTNVRDLRILLQSRSR